MKLLIDAGNSRVKWALHDADAWRAEGWVENEAIAELAQAWRDFPVSRVIAASVAGPAVAAALQAVAPCEVEWVRSEASRFGVRNHYHDPAEQGVDRWLAVLAAHERCRGDVIVACAGTALTVESLTEDGDYLGGLIAPGFRLMLTSLAAGTAQLARPAGAVVDFPRGTEDALASGAMAALAGAIERARDVLAQQTGRARPMVLLTGGDAREIAPCLAAPLEIVDNLVLQGLLRVANAS
ncbi:type III pantothenate kinase [Paludibacterium yongneupense]|uniref:type III pantothenate kinase n=1 Tax=Paludibacterium yongneupense TaxID=400061 RepID=UPI00040276D0|nr:type III pantothenate kinase [Paludibacterium yongneupense]